jgi:hypothetical protein
MGNKESPKSTPKSKKERNAKCTNLTKKIMTMMKYRQPLSGD